MSPVPEHGVPSALLARMCELAGTREDRKKHGVFYTPFPLAEHIARLAADAAALSAPDIPALRILDPACGCGEFLLALLTLFWERYHALPDPRNVCGIELQDAAAQITDIRIREFYLTHTGRPGHPSIVRADALRKMPFPRNSFDIVVGNPPFVQICDIPSPERVALRKRYRFAAGRFNLFELFLELGGSCLKPGGVCGWLIPDRVLRNVQSAELRAWLNSDWTPICMDPLPEGGFPGTVVDYISCVLRNVPSGRKNDVDEPDFMEVMLQHGVPLGSIAEVRDGIIQGAVGDRLFLDAPIDETCRPMLTGSDIRRGVIRTNRLWVCYRPDEMKQLELSRLAGKSVGLRMRSPQIFERPKILTRQTSDSIIAAFDAEGKYYYNNTLHGTHITHPGYMPEFVLAVLNSDILNQYYRTLTGEQHKVFAQVKIAILRSLPVCRATRRQQSAVLKAKSPEVREAKIRALYGLASPSE